jgi:hypothetical protein
MDGPPKRSPKPYLHLRSVDGLLGEAIAITGNAHALLKLQAQIARALEGEDSYPLEEGVYLDVDGQPFEVAVKRARSKREMREPNGATKPQRDSVSPTTREKPMGRSHRLLPRPVSSKAPPRTRQGASD